MRALVTGCAGFVGRRFVNRLLDSGYDVVGVDNLYTGKNLDDWPHKPKKKFALHYMDVRDYFVAHASSRFDLVVHLAAIVGGRVNIESDPLAVATDLSIDAEMFNWVVRSKLPPKVIYFSSPAAYPNWLQTKGNFLNVGGLREGMLTFDAEIGCPDMTYGWAKLTGEYLATFAHEQYGLDVRIYRPFGGYGDDQDMSYPVPAICKRVMDKENPIIVWGSGDQQRDFIWIDDVVKAVEKTMDVPELSGKPLNLGTGRATSFRELARIACTIVGHDAVIKNDDTKPEGVFSRFAEITEMSKYYIPQMTLEEGLKIVTWAIGQRQSGSLIKPSKL
jgi:GDP-L-fucose synthase